MKIARQYVPFEIAELLASKGFDIPCEQVYNNLGQQWNSHYGTMTNSDPDSGTHCTCPELWMVLEWLENRVNYLDIWVEPAFSTSPKVYKYRICHRGEMINGFVDTSNTKIEAYWEAIKYTLNNLL